jgi:hypothetical protein
VTKESGKREGCELERERERGIERCRGVERLG